MYYGRIYYWQKGFGSRVLPTHFDKAERWIEESTWFDTEIQEERTEGGYSKKFKTIRKPYAFEKLLDIATDFTFEKAGEWEPKNEKMKIPERLIFRDTLPKWWPEEAPKTEKSNEGNTRGFESNKYPAPGV
jgi:competence protein CoiA